MSKNCKIERTQKRFLKAMKEKFSGDTGTGMSYTALKGTENQQAIIQSAHPTLIAERERLG